ncbi:MAG: proton-conducting transporter membrane subunit [Candidatus Micrarchaeia archaeon]
MLYSLIPLLVASLGVFVTPHFIRNRTSYPPSIKLISVFASFLALLLVLLFPTDNTFPHLFREDSLSFIFSLLASLIGFITIIYSTWYVEENHREFYSAMLLFIASMIGLVISNNILLLVLCWEVTTAVSFILVRMKGTENAAKAANTVWVINQLGGIAMLVGAAYLYAGGIHTLDSLFIAGNLIGTSLFLFAAIAKSAVFPFHPWLPSAMEAYSPVSALLHSAAMVMAGMYLLIRMTPLLLFFAELRGIVLLLGLLTILASSTKAFLENDLKRVLAYSTLTNIGMIATCIAFASPFSIAAALFHIISHALFKASLFLEAGVFEHSLGTREIDKLGGVVGKLPITTFFFSLSALSAMGVPATLGFTSKFAMYESTLPFISLFLLFGTVLAATYYACILGHLLIKQKSKKLHEEARSITAIAPLSLGSVLLAVYPFPIMNLCSKAVNELLNTSFTFPTLVNPPMTYLSVLLTIGLALAVRGGRATLPFRSGEPLRGKLPTPSLQIYDVRKTSEKIYSLIDVEVWFRMMGPAGELIYNMLSKIRERVEVR